MEEEIKKAAEINYPKDLYFSEEQALIRRLAFIKGVEWQQEQMEKLKDFDTWKEWKNTGIIKSE